jgi:hypothetical protein
MRCSRQQIFMSNPRVPSDGIDIVHSMCTVQMRDELVVPDWVA